MVDTASVVWMGLVLTQTLLYRVSPGLAVRRFWLLGFFYMLIFFLICGVEILCARAGARFFEFSLASLLLFILSQVATRLSTAFEKEFQEAPDFYFLSFLWVGFAWLGIFRGIRLLDGFFWSLVAAFLFPVFAAIKERLKLSRSALPGLETTLLLISGGLFLLGFSAFLR